MQHNSCTPSELCFFRALWLSGSGETHGLRRCLKRELTAKSSMELVALPRPFAQFMQESSVATVLKFYLWL